MSLIAWWLEMPMPLPPVWTLALAAAGLMGWLWKNDQQGEEP
jgi:hypothetical protein